MKEDMPQDFEPLLAFIGRSRVWRFFSRNCLLCFLIAAGIRCILDYTQTETKMLTLIGLIGSVFCLKQFGLDRCIWIWLLAGVIYPFTIVFWGEVHGLRADGPFKNFQPQSVDLVSIALCGMLFAVPCALLFIKKLNGVTALWKVPLSVFSLILVMNPFFLLLFLCAARLLCKNC